MTIAAGQKTEVSYRIRKTGEIITEKIFAEKTLRWMYEDKIGFQVFKYLMNNAIFCWLYGKMQDLPGSKKKIAAFVHEHQINMEEAEKAIENYISYNDFFRRCLKPGSRPFNPNADIFSAPAEGKVLVYPKLEDNTRIPVKGATITIAGLLASETEAQRYIGGAAMIVRLAPYDYHRFHFPDDGEAAKARNIKGQYHSVNPIALAKVPDLFCRNKRSVTEFKSKNFGTIAYIEVGAICVGTIIQTYQPGKVTKGQEKGYFQFGGSTVVLLFEPGAIVFDADLIKDSAMNLEVHLQALSSIGKRP